MCMYHCRKVVLVSHISIVVSSTDETSFVFLAFTSNVDLIELPKRTTNITSFHQTATEEVTAPCRPPSPTTRPTTATLEVLTTVPTEAAVVPPVRFLGPSSEMNNSRNGAQRL